MNQKCFKRLLAWRHFRGVSGRPGSYCEHCLHYGLIPKLYTSIIQICSETRTWFFQSKDPSFGPRCDFCLRKPPSWSKSGHLQICIVHGRLPFWGSFHSLGVMDRYDLGNKLGYVSLRGIQKIRKPFERKHFSRLWFLKACIPCPCRSTNNPAESLVHAVYKVSIFFFLSKILHAKPFSNLSVSYGTTDRSGGFATVYLVSRRRIRFSQGWKIPTLEIFVHVYLPLCTGLP